MSFEPITWALKHAPVASVTEYAVLGAYATFVNAGGYNAFASYGTVAERTHLDRKTVERTVRKLVGRRLMARGDQERVAHIPKNSRPVVYDVLVPAAFYYDLAAINREMVEQGCRPITAENRPIIGAAPPRIPRSDAKVSGGTESPVGGDSESRPGGLRVPSGGTESPVGGDSESRPGGLRVPQTSQGSSKELPRELASPPAVGTAEVPRARTPQRGEGEEADDTQRRDVDEIVSRLDPRLALLPDELDEVGPMLANAVRAGYKPGFVADWLNDQLPGAVRFRVRFIAKRLEVMPPARRPAPRVDPLQPYREARAHRLPDDLQALRAQELRALVFGGVVSDAEAKQVELVDVDDPQALPGQLGVPLN